MQQGQISFDVLLMAVVLAVVFGGLIVITGSVEQTNKESAIALQQKHILSETINVISNTHVLADGGNGTRVQFTIPTLLVPGERAGTLTLDPAAGPVSLDCSVLLFPATNTVSVVATAGTETFQQTRSAVFDTVAFTYPPTTTCGSVLTIQKV
jgi:hypothetical protein